jgi:hypothetical protein
MAGDMTDVSDAKRSFPRAGVVIAVVIILGAYALEAHARRQAIATPATHSDQAAYLAYARQMRESSYNVVGIRNRMPVFPFLLSLIYRPGLTETQSLERAQSFNVNLSILLLALVFLLFRKFFPDYHALALLVMTAFGVFLYRAGIVQGELLFYFLSFCAFVLLVRMLVAPRWWLAIPSGAAVGLAYLTKASMLPALAIWAAVFIAQTIWQFYGRSTNRGREIWSRAGLLLLVIGTFWIVVFPYVQTSKRLYGHYFYNVNSTFYMWCDSWPEAVAFTEVYSDPDRRRALQPDQIPSPAKYWREHSVQQIAQRLIGGVTTMCIRSAKVTGYYKFILLFAIAGAVLAARRRTAAARFIADRGFAAIFCALFFFVYVLLYAWYGAIITDSRFILALFLPFIFAASIFLLGVADGQTFAFRRRDIPVAKLFAGALVALALIDLGYNAMRVFRSSAERANRLRQLDVDLRCADGFQATTLPASPLYRLPCNGGLTQPRSL